MQTDHTAAHATPDDERIFEFTPEFLVYVRSAAIVVVGCAMMAFAGASLGDYLDPGLGAASAEAAAAT